MTKLNKITHLELWHSVFVWLSEIAINIIVCFFLPYVDLAFVFMTFSYTLIDLNES